jgi:CheY-like chemotaxis protein
MVKDLQSLSAHLMPKRIRVLHVDDEPADLEITRIFLKREAQDNFEIVGVLSAREALERVKAGGFDIIVSDYRMPGMDGIEFLEALRRSENVTNHIPFILFTGKGGEQVAKAAFNKGADRYIAKNGNTANQCSELASAIRELVTEKKVKSKPSSKL